MTSVPGPPKVPPPGRRVGAPGNQRKVVHFHASSVDKLQDLLDKSEGRCDFCKIDLDPPSASRAVPGSTPVEIHLDPSSTRLSAYRVACPCCALEHSPTYLISKFESGEVRAYVWADSTPSKPSPQAVAHALRASNAWLRRLDDENQALPGYTPLLGNHAILLRALLEEGHEFDPIWNANWRIYDSMVRLADRLKLPPLPAQGTHFWAESPSPEERAWLESCWARVVSTEPGAWRELRSDLLLLPGPSLALTSRFDLDTEIKAARLQV